MNNDNRAFGMPIILASQSPRRQQLLSEAGYNFVVKTPDDSAEQSVSLELSPEEYVLQAAKCKARNVAQTLDTGIILGADTIAECDGEKLGKPRDRRDAADMLTKMSGREHRVLTGIAIWHRPSDRFITHLDETLLFMNSIDDESLANHLDSNNWVGKAGAFGFQDGLDWVRIVKGRVSNVVGLPVELLPELLQKLKHETTEPTQ